MLGRTSFEVVLPKPNWTLYSSPVTVNPLLACIPNRLYAHPLRNYTWSYTPVYGSRPLGLCLSRTPPSGIHPTRRLDTLSSRIQSYDHMARGRTLFTQPPWDDKVVLTGEIPAKGCMEEYPRETVIPREEFPRRK